MEQDKEFYEKLMKVKNEISDFNVNKQYPIDQYSQSFRLGITHGLDIAANIISEILEEMIK